MSPDEADAATVLSGLVEDILGLPVLVDDPAWETYASVAEVDDDSVAVSAFRYTGTARPVPSPPVRAVGAFARLRELMRAESPEPWQVCIVKIQRHPARFVANFVYSEHAELWRVRPASYGRVAEALRPVAADFIGGAPEEVPSSLDAEAATPQRPHGWTSAPRAAHEAPTDELEDLVRRGASTRVRPPSALPGAVVLRPTLPSWTRGIVVAAAVVGLAGLIATRQWAFLIVAASGALFVAVGNAVVGRARVAVDGPLLAVCPFARWHGPVDLRTLSAIDYRPALSTRMAARWQFVDRDGATLVLHAGHGFMTPGLERHLASWIDPAVTNVSAAAAARLDAHAGRRT